MADLNFRTLEGISRGDIINMISDGGKSETAVSEAEFIVLDAENDISLGAFDGERLCGCVLNSSSGNEVLLLAMGADDNMIQQSVIEHCAELLSGMGKTLYKAESSDDMQQKNLILAASGFEVSTERAGERYTPFGPKAVKLITYQKALKAAP